MLSLAAGPLSGSPAGAGVYQGTSSCPALAVKNSGFATVTAVAQPPLTAWGTRAAVAALVPDIRKYSPRSWEVSAFLSAVEFQCSSVGQQSYDLHTHHQLHEDQESGEDWHGLNIDLQNLGSMEWLEQQFLSLSSWHGHKLYQWKNSSSPDSVEIQV